MRVGIGNRVLPTAGRTVPPRYNENITAPQVYTRPEDITAGIRATAPANIPVPVGPMEGIGALLTAPAAGDNGLSNWINQLSWQDRDIFEERAAIIENSGEGLSRGQAEEMAARQQGYVGSEMVSAFGGTQTAPRSTAVPGQQEFMPPEQLASTQAEFGASNERRFATPGGQLPSFTNDRKDLSRGVLQQELEALTDKAASPENKLSEIKWSANDAGNLMSFGSDQADRMYDPRSAWALHYGLPENITPEEKAAEVAENAPQLAIAGALILHNVLNRNYEKQAGNHDSEMIDPYENYDSFALATGAVGKREAKNRIADPVTEVFEAGEPMLNQMVTSVAQNFMDFATAKGEEMNQELHDSSRDQAILFLKDLTDQGQISWARNARGKVIPVPGDYQTLHRDNAKQIAKLYDVDSRGSVASGIMAPQFPAVTNAMFGNKAKKIFITKQGKVVVTDAAEAMMQLQGSIPISVNPILAVMMEQMNAARENKDNSTFDSTLSEVDAENVKALIAKHGTKQGLQIVEQKIKLLEKEMRDVADRGKDNQPRYMLLKQSIATLRYFHIANNLNLMGQKGTTRTTFSFGGTQPTRISSSSGLWGRGAPALISKIDKIYKGNKGKGVARGQETQKRLYDLKKSNPTAFQAMNYYFNLGAQMAKHIDHAGAIEYSKNNFNGRQIHLWTPLEYITYGTASQEKAASLGKQLIDAVNNNGLTEFAKSQGWMRDKGEWQYPSSVLIDAHQISIAADGSHITLSNIMESDARTSNAAIIGIHIDDGLTTPYLGLDPSQLDTTGENLHAGLREKIFDTVGEDIVSVFSGPDDGPYLNSWARLLESISAASPRGAAKIYGRGLVVAGLYGKTPQKMYSEAQTFFDKVSKLAAGSGGNLEIARTWAEMRQLYGSDKLRMFDDLTDLFSHSMGRHMSKLSGYQNAMRALGGAMAAINSPTSITNMLGGVQELSGNNLSPVMDDTVKEQAFHHLNFISRNIGGMMIPEYTVQRDYAGASETRLDEDQDGNTVVVRGRAGSKQRSAWPVDIIQGGDSTIMTLSVLAMNSPEDGFSGLPVQAIAIHDAIVSGPDGHLIAVNAYNNIAIPAYAQQAPAVIQGVFDTYNKHLRLVKAKHREGGANIGTQFIGEENTNNSFHGLTGFFDRMYDSAYGANSQADITNPDLSIDNNRSTSWLTPNQLARSEEKRKSTLKGNLTKKAILEAAHSHGYLPPTEANLEARKFRHVEGADFIALVDIMRASSKILDEGETPHPSMYKALKQLPAELRPAVSNFTYHTVGYNGDSLHAAASGLIRKMGTNSTQRNSVIDSLTNASNEITSMVPA